MSSAIEAISFAPLVPDWIKNSVTIRVLHVFSQAINLINQQAEIVSIVDQTIGNGPFNVVVPTTEIFEFVNAESEVRIEATTIILNEFKISITPAKPWNSMPDWSKIQKTAYKIDSYINFFLDLLSKESPPESFARIMETTSSSHQISHDIFDTAQSTILKLSKALSVSDTEIISAASHDLAGLGSGLTPAGDDFLMGVIHGIWAVLPLEKAMQTSNIISSASISRTSSLSAAWLNTAARGEAGEAWHDLFNAMLTDDPDQIIKCAKTILTTGHTSGADALGGFVFAIRSLTP